MVQGRSGWVLSRSQQAPARQHAVVAAARGGGAHLGGDLRGVYIEVPTNEVQRASKLERSSPGVAS
eukprot:SAG31_NODE_1841_length_7117_cov_12.976207_3_plen_66_part_00